MEQFIFLIELIGTVAFAVSGAVTGIRKHMDIFGVCVLGVTTAVGGGVIRDLILGNTPPVMFRSPVYALVAVITSILVFLPPIRKSLLGTHRVDLLLLIMDTLGLGVFTVVGVQHAAVLPQETGKFLMVFVGVITGVGGGLLRDIMAGNPPYIFVKHIYACASIAGGIACAFLWDVFGGGLSMFIGAVLVIVIRFLAAHYRWSLPKANDIVQE